MKLNSALHINGGTDVNGTRVTLKMDGKAYVPASLLKGMVRENFTKLWRIAVPDDVSPCCAGNGDTKPCSCIPCRMFGTGGFQKSRIYFDHLETDQPLEYSHRSNIAIDRHSRKVVDQALVFTQTVEPKTKKGEQTVFCGEITVYYPPEMDLQKQQQIEAVMRAAVHMITNIGLGKSRGLGFVETDLSVPEGGWLCAEK
jgi:CRISPR/Cas system CSM-associated protein Csm3 (group 7 of RAMP superfamily)